MRHLDASPLLRLALRGNALFSTVSGLTLLLAAAALGPRLGLPVLSLRVVGAVLLPFAWGLWNNSRRAVISRAEARLAVLLDLSWVAGSAALVFGGLWPLTPAGRWTVLGVADVVLVFAFLQTVGLRRARTTPSTAGL